MTHNWSGRIYLKNGSVRTVCTECSAIRDTQNKARNCQSPAPAPIWNMLEAVERLDKRKEGE